MRNKNQFSIEVLSSDLDSEVLYRLLSDELSDYSNLEATIQHSELATRALTPELVVAIATPIAALLGVTFREVIKALIRVHELRHQKEENALDRATGLVVIKIGDRELSLPSGISESEKQTFIELAEKWHREDNNPIQIAYITNGGR